MEFSEIDMDNSKYALLGLHFSFFNFRLYLKGLRILGGFWFSLFYIYF